MSLERIPEILRKVRKIELITRGIVREAVGGEYHSVFKGQGIDFDDFREYQPGDEVRSIDWNVTARMGFPYIKKFVEEREMTVFLVVDVGPSMFYGSERDSKRDVAAEIAGVFAFSANANQDKAGLALCSSEVDLYLPPRKGSIHVLRIIREILAAEPKLQVTGAPPPPSLLLALERLTNRLTKRALVIVISDFQQTGYERALGVCAIRHDVVAVQVSDPNEITLARLGGPLLAVDPTSGRQMKLDAKFRRNYLVRRAQWQAELDRKFKTLSIDKIDIISGQDYLPALHSFFKRRAARQ